MRTLVTGPFGFVGEGLIRQLLRDPAQEIVAGYRSGVIRPAERVHAYQVGELSAHTDWQAALARVDTVVHLAARVHVMSDGVADPMAEFRRINVEGTLNLARQAAAAGVRRFVYISSIKVNGEATRAGRPFRAAEHAAPVDPYAVSKHEAEQALRQLTADSALQVVVIRPPLVYGPAVRANFRSMMGWLRRGVPLPLGAINNKRSLVGLDNLCDLIVTCAEHPAAAGQTFLASDGEDVSTTELLRRLGLALGRPARLLPVPARLLQAGLTALGRRDIGQRLCSSLQVDISETCATLGWAPPVSLDEGLRRAAQAYLAEAGEAGVASRREEY